MARYLLAGAPKSEAGLFGDATPSIDLGEQHPIFSRLAHGAHSDILTITAEDEEGAPREILIDEIRKLHAFFGLSSGETGWRIIIIDGADAMNRNAQNALLKMLEEPPTNALIFLVCHNAGQMLPTIRSRCRALKLAPLNATAMAQVLGHDIPTEILEIAAGSPGLALQLEATDYANAILQLNRLLEHPEESLEIAEKLTKKGTESHWPTYLLLLRHVVSKRILAQPSDALFSLWQRINQLQGETEGLNMDKKMALMGL
jgi:DNA polymerase-3 subunit delta'